MPLDLIERRQTVTMLAPATTDLLTDEMLARFDERAPVYDRENRFFDEDFEELRASGIESSETLGRKRLAYPIKKQNDGLYMLTHFEADSRSLKELNRVMNITEGLLRHLVVRRDED